jgi:hypothetical protein
MEARMQTLDLSAVAIRPGDASADLGAAPQLQWIKIADLVVDETYQRPVTDQGRRSIRAIALHFSWSRFAPVVVSPVEGGRYAIVDGQHRTTAAALRGIESVPCAVIIADRKGQAAAFAAINGNVTKMSSLSLYRAGLAAGESRAVAINRVCKQAGVIVLPYPKAAKTMERGETLAPAMIWKAMQMFGEAAVIAGLEAIVKAGDGNPGFVRTEPILAYSDVMKRHPGWANHDSLLDVLDDFDLSEAWRRCQFMDPGEGRARWNTLGDQLEAYLTRTLGASEAKAA